MTAGPDVRLGPYERWTFTEALGRPFAPSGDAVHPTRQPRQYTAIMDGGARDGGAVPEGGPDLDVRIPPLFRVGKAMPRIVPFAMRDPRFGPIGPDDAPDADLRAMLARLSSSAPSDGAPPRFRVNFPVAHGAWPERYDATAPSEGWQPPSATPRAVLAVIDDGIPFAGRAFLARDGRTRVSHAWLQTAPAPISHKRLSRASDPVSPVPFGREVTNGEIDGLRAHVGDDEARLYRWVEAPGPDRDARPLRHGTHGSHVMTLAAGNASMHGLDAVPDDVAVIAVQLPRAIALDTSGFGKDTYVLSALHYAFERAARIEAGCGSGPLPLIVNLSYGWSAGRHDGQSELEEAIADLIALRRDHHHPETHLVLPTGNTFADAMHAAFTAHDVADGAASVGWQIQPDDRTSSYLEIWFPEDLDPEGWRVGLTPPPGAALDGCGAGPAVVTVPTLGPGDGADATLFVDLRIGGKVVGQLSVDKHRGTRWRVMAALIPTIYTRGQDRRAPAGRWTVTVERGDGAAAVGEAQEIHLWVQRDDDPVNLRAHGRQSRLVNPNPTNARRRPLDPEPPVTGPVRPYGSISGIASVAAATRVAGHVASTERPAPYSSAGGVRFGPTADDGARKPVAAWGAQPDLSAASDRSPLRPGLVSAGMLSGTRLVLTGTSTAAPCVARRTAVAAATGVARREIVASQDRDGEDPRARARSGGRPVSRPT